MHPWAARPIRGCCCNGAAGGRGGALRCCAAAPLLLLHASLPKRCTPCRPPSHSPPPPRGSTLAGTAAQRSSGARSLTSRRCARWPGGCAWSGAASRCRAAALRGGRHPWPRPAAEPTAAAAAAAGARRPQRWAARQMAAGASRRRMRSRSKSRRRRRAARSKSRSSPRTACCWVSHGCFRSKLLGSGSNMVQLSLQQARSRGTRIACCWATYARLHQCGSTAAASAARNCSATQRRSQ